MRTLIAALLMATPATADITVTFADGAPVDRLTVANSGECPVPAGSLVMTLDGSAVPLVFDVVDGGAGVEVFQPLTVIEGTSYLTTPPRLRDGDTSLTLEMGPLPAGARIVATLDMDDTGQRGITVSGSEIAGARVQMGTATGVFDGTGRAVLANLGCVTS